MSIIVVDHNLNHNLKKSTEFSIHASFMNF